MARDLAHKLTCTRAVCPTCGRTASSRTWLRWMVTLILMLVAIQALGVVLYRNMKGGPAEEAPTPPTAPPSSGDTR